ncbi:6-carboxytetrahydropterin synthase [Nonomuraea sp. NPDC050790]|uniref:6-carboxytetrahydropterin synthase n=1 Tax=Nonomuraea sp. NPDC050790 TaxID=3364371 RepID=UPI0037A90338
MFDSAHLLPQLDGKCANLHGHTWHVRVSALRLLTRRSVAECNDHGYEDRQPNYDSASLRYRPPSIGQRSSPLSPRESLFHRDISLKETLHLHTNRPQSTAVHAGRRRTVPRARTARPRGRDHDQGRRARERQFSPS